jgi:hypothetical protein
MFSLWAWNKDTNSERDRSRDLTHNFWADEDVEILEDGTDQQAPQEGATTIESPEPEEGETMNEDPEEEDMTPVSLTNVPPALLISKVS